MKQRGLGIETSGAFNIANNFNIIYFKRKTIALGSVPKALLLGIYPLDETFHSPYPKENEVFR